MLNLDALEALSHPYITGRDVSLGSIPGEYSRVIFPGNNHSWGKFPSSSGIFPGIFPRNLLPCAATSRHDRANKLTYRQSAGVNTFMCCSMVADRVPHFIPPCKYLRTAWLWKVLWICESMIVHGITTDWKETLEYVSIRLFTCSCCQLYSGSLLVLLELETLPGWLRKVVQQRT